MAGDAGGIRAGRAFVEAYLDDNQLTRGLRGLEKKFKALGGSISAVGRSLAAGGAAFTAPFLGAAKVFADVGSELADASARTGASVENLSALGYAAQQTGASLGDVETGIRKMQKAIVQGRQGSDEAVTAFASIGLNVQKLAQMSPDQQFEAVAAAIGDIPDPTNRAAAAMQVFGKSGTALLPMIGDLDALTGEAERLGLVMSSEDAAAADALGDAMGAVQATLKRVMVLVGSALGPALADLAKTTTGLVSRAIEWADANQGLIKTVFLVGAGVAAAGAVLVGLGTAVSAAGAALGTIAAAISGVGAVLGALLSPIGLIAAGVAAAGYAFVKFTASGQQALAGISGAMGGLAADAQAAFGGIADALAAGDIGLAAKVLWAGLKMEWLKGVAFLQGVWNDWGMALRDVMGSVSTFIAGVWVNMWYNFQIDAIKAWGFLRDGFTTFTGFMAKQLTNLGGLFEKTFSGIAIAAAAVWDAVTNFNFSALGDNLLAKLKANADRINADVAQRKAAIDQGTADTLTQRQAARDRKVGDMTTSRDQELQALSDQKQADSEARRAASGKSLAGTMAQLEAVQKEFADLTAEAASKRAAAGGAGDKAAGGAGDKAAGATPEFNPDALDRGLKQTERRIETKGTFSASAVRDLAVGDSVQNDQLNEQKEMRKYLAKIDEKARQGRLVFTS